MAPVPEETLASQERGGRDNFRTLPLGYICKRSGSAAEVSLTLPSCRAEYLRRFARWLGVMAKNFAPRDVDQSWVFAALGGTSSCPPGHLD